MTSRAAAYCSTIQPRWLTLDQAAKYCTLSVYDIKRLVADGYILGSGNFDHGRKDYVNKESLDWYLHENKIQPIATNTNLSELKGPLIYVIEALGIDAIKIGFTTTKISKRLISLQTSTPLDLFVIGAKKQATQKDEKEIHNFLSSHKIRGEWFRKNNEALNSLIIFGFEFIFTPQAPEGSI